MKFPGAYSALADSCGALNIDLVTPGSHAFQDAIGSALKRALRSKMRRREFIAGLGGATILPLAVCVSGLMSMTDDRRHGA